MDLITPPIPFFSSARRKSSALGAVLGTVFPPWRILSGIWLCWDKQHEVTEPTSPPLATNTTEGYSSLNLALLPLRIFYSHYRHITHCRSDRCCPLPRLAPAVCGRSGEQPEARSFNAAPLKPLLYPGERRLQALGQSVALHKGKDKK